MKKMQLDENCFIIPPLTGPREEAAYSGKPASSRPTPRDATVFLFGADDGSVRNTRSLQLIERPGLRKRAD